MRQVQPEGNKLWPAIVTPVIVGDMVVIAYGRNDRGTPRLHGIRLSGSGDVTPTNHVWLRDDVGAFVPTPAVYQGQIILLRDRGEVASIDPSTGKTNWEAAFTKHRSNFYSSPLIAGDQLYAPREDGTVFVAHISGDKCELLSENNMAESIISSPVRLKPPPPPRRTAPLLHCFRVIERENRNFFWVCHCSERCRFSISLAHNRSEQCGTTSRLPLDFGPILSAAAKFARRDHCSRRSWINRCGQSTSS